MAGTALPPRGVMMRVIHGRPRLLAAFACGVLGWMALSPRMHGLTRGLLAWDFGCTVFLVLATLMFSFPHRRGIAADAAAQQEGEWTIFWITVGGVFASFAAIIGEFSATKGMPPDVRGAHVALVGVTLFLSWLMTHTAFALRYAHEYYETSEDGSGIVGGLEFPGDSPPDYWDFFYFALVLGMTFQVSDVQITDRQLRRLAAAHGLLGFLFNTIILALSVNIGAGLL